MSKVEGISHFSAEVQKFVQDQFAHGNYSFLKFCRDSPRTNFVLKSVQITAPVECFYLRRSAYRGAISTSNTQVFDDYEMWFSPEPPAAAKISTVGTEVEFEVPPLVNEKKKPVLSGGEWNGFPMSDEISKTEALYATCSPNGVYLNGKKLVLRDGMWHKN